MKIITLTLGYYDKEDELSGEVSASFRLRLDHMDCFQRHIPDKIRVFLGGALRDGCAESGLGVAWDGVAVDDVEGLSLYRDGIHGPRRTAEDVWTDVLATLPST